ncbi:MAG: hypothetical protein KA399_01585 [Chitinophagaceae bacterium]|mgnify:FL=1|jgi:hypothetical protein|nr:hypothetical protein [Chitinophagaceae bacterium]HQZ75584.1 hypothetical protein [Chitinophagaceae bacterium]
MVHPYLPDIIKGIVERINNVFSTRETDPFTVLFTHGNYAQANRDFYKAPQEGKNNLIWLKMPFDQVVGKSSLYYSDLVFSIAIATVSDNKLSQTERDNTTIKPRLYPIYDLLMQEIDREGWFVYNRTRTPEHRAIVESYWGIGDVNGQDADNLFKIKADVMSVLDLKIKLRKSSCRSQYNPLELTDVPYQPVQLTFFKDIELIVDGGADIDPADGADTVLIPDLAGFEYDVVQRAFGQLRKERAPEIVINAAGGFTLTGGYKFSKDDTYIIKLRPTFTEVSELPGVLQKNIAKVGIEI